MGGLVVVLSESEQEVTRKGKIMKMITATALIKPLAPAIMCSRFFPMRSPFLLLAIEVATLASLTFKQMNGLWT